MRADGHENNQIFLMMDAFGSYKVGKKSKQVFIERSGSIAAFLRYLMKVSNVLEYQRHNLTKKESKCYLQNYLPRLFQ